MDATTALRLKKVELSHGAAERTAALQAQRHVAVLAVGVTVGASAGLGALAGQFPPSGAAAGVALAIVAVMTQLRALRLVSERLDRATAKALVAIDNLIGQENESDVDAKADAPRT